MATMRLQEAILAAGSISMAATLAGCAHTVSGAAVFDFAQAAGQLRPGDADQVLLSAVEIADLVGTTLQIDADRSRPISGS